MVTEYILRYEYGNLSTKIKFKVETIPENKLEDILTGYIGTNRLFIAPDGLSNKRFFILPSVGIYYSDNGKIKFVLINQTDVISKDKFYVKKDGEESFEAEGISENPLLLVDFENDIIYVMEERISKIPILRRKDVQKILEDDYIKRVIVGLYMESKKPELTILKI